ncbi:SusC/RagA family TonB-linked outer membrane protein [Phocaeicola intestinalis]|uniref:SusC/RagA family TonB-linked outer membrane protein n=1 Tax=Phocaeicola intestinalis TaxID=2762212 RepID=UPI0021D15040|nr:TonB-dependent receptor [Phocaeicola intestinalis]
MSSSAGTLVVSFIGLQTQEVKIQPVMKVVLKSDAEVLDEVLVVAYGTAKKSAFTGSASTIKADKIEARTVSNVTNALAGQVAGVQITQTNGQPGTSASIRIRGVGSMSASNSPLYVVDGVPYDGEISAINPQDIESMTVLKDAAANAIYGARGANGVVLITTKRGERGEAKVTFDAKWGSNKRGVPNYDVMTDPAMYYETAYRALYNSQFYNGKSASESYAYADRVLLDANNGGLGYLVYTVPEGQKLIGTNFKLNPNATLGYSDGSYYYTPDDWYDEIFGKGNLRQEYNVTISGASDKLSYYVSAGYLDDNGIIDNSGFERFSGRAKADYQAKPWLKVGTNIAYTYYNIKSPSGQTSDDWGSTGNLFYISNLIAPIYPMYVRNADGSIKVDDRGMTVYDFGSGSTNFNRPTLMGNPAGTLSLDDQNTYSDMLSTKWYATITPIEGLSITATLGANVLNQRANALQNPFYGSGVSAQGYVSVEHQRIFDINQQYMATYKTTFNNVHNLDLLAGFESYSHKIQYLGGSNSMLYNPFIGELNNAINTPPSVSSYTNEYVTMGYLARAQYDYDGKYFVSASYRRDASSRFHPDHRWGNFGSVGLAWLMSKETFMEDLTWINMLKLKASYGVQGNDNLGTGSAYYYAYADQFTVNNSNGDYSVVFAYKGNKDLTWETSHAFNVGFDFELFGSRLNGTVEYFSRKTSDLLYNQPVPISFGYSTVPKNVGSIINKGIELDLNGVLYRSKNIEWGANFNLTHYKNKITDLDPTVKENGIRYSNAIYRIGGSLYNAYLPVYAGVNPENGLPQYYVDPDNGDYTITTNYELAQQSDLGSTLAKVYGGFGTTLNVYGFDLGIQLSYQLGGKVYDGTYEALMQTGDLMGQNFHKDVLNAWTPENPNTDIPRMCTSDISSQRMSSRFLVSSDYLSFNNVTIGYTLPKRWIAKLGISNLRLYVTGDNLGVITCRKGFDPRQYFGLGSSTGSGNFSYSALRTITGGVTLNF